MTDLGPDAVAGAREVRAEDAFDEAAVMRWLAEEAGVEGELVEVRQFSGGASNLTYLLRVAPGPFDRLRTAQARGTGEAARGTSEAARGFDRLNQPTDGAPRQARGTGEARELILRRPPAGRKAKGAHDMGREYRIQSQLAPVFPYVATMVGFCADESVIGSEFYVMERLVGHIPRKELGLDLTEAQVRELCSNVLDLLVDLHSLDPDAAGLADLGKGAGYVQRQVAGWSARYRNAKTWNVGSFEKVIAWLEAHQPADRRTCLIHNDFRLDNIVLSPDDPTKPIGLLDWEMATLGDPLMDLGGAMAYWVQADDDRLFRIFRRQPSHLPGMMTRQEMVDAYCARMGFELSEREWAFYEVFGLFRLAVIVQQIYYRYHHKQTTNPAFRRLWLACVLLELRCRRIIRRKS